jgi:2-methylcitrate dehydratase
VRTKEEADHSLPYMVAVAVLDDQVMPEQYRQERIQQHDVQKLLKKVRVQSNKEFAERFPAEMPCRVQVSLQNGRALKVEKHDYEGFSTRPFSWEQAVAKFTHLSSSYVDTPLRNCIVEAVRSIETLAMKELTSLLARIHHSHSCAAQRVGQPG